MPPFYRWRNVAGFAGLALCAFWVIRTLVQRAEEWDRKVPDSSPGGPKGPSLRDSRKVVVPLPIRTSPSLETLEKKFGESDSMDIVEEASWESFPASDAPAWTLSRVGKRSLEKLE